MNVRPGVPRCILLFFICLGLFACTRKKNCGKIFEIPTNTTHQADITPLLSVPEFKEILEKYPGRIQVMHVYEHVDIVSFQANLYYKGISIFDESLNGNLYNGSVSFSGPVPDTIPVATIPAIPINQAIRTAKQVRSFEDNCISFQLGFINMNRFIPDSIPDYHLTWKIQDNNNFRNVAIDAHSGEVLMVDGLLVSVVIPDCRTMFVSRFRTVNLTDINSYADLVSFN